LQIAIWKLVGDSYFQLNSANDYGAAGYIADVTSSGYTGPVADLIALSGPGQDYVVQHVPEGGVTAILMGMALCALVMFHRKLTPKELAPCTTGSQRTR
jgi:hypothetical protein